MIMIKKDTDRNPFDVNMDSMSPEELIDWQIDVNRHTSYLWWSKYKPELSLYEFEKGLNLLYRYSVLKYAAIASRQLGLIDNALVFDKHCDALYFKLPAWAKSW